MMIGRASWVVAMVAMLGAGCAAKRGTSTPAAAAKNLPFEPRSIRADPTGPLTGKGPYPLELSVRATHHITAADEVALRVVSSGTEVARVPVVIDVPTEWNGDHSAKLFSGKVLVPVGDYDVELIYQTRPVLGHSFKIVPVPVWGGGQQVQFFVHQRTRLDLDGARLWLARWVVEDEPTQAYLIEWWHDGRRSQVTKGRTPEWPSYGVDAAVRAAQPRKDAGPRKTLWTYGRESYEIPRDLIVIAGQWEARVYREGAPPVAIAFELSDAEETRESRVAVKGQRLSAELFLRPIQGLGVEAFAAIPGKQYPLVIAAPTLVAPVPFDRGAHRALFRSPELARKWRELLAVNGSPGPSAAGGHKQLLGRQAEADRLAKAKRLRAQVVELIKQHSGPWVPDELPR